MNVVQPRMVHMDRVVVGWCMSIMSAKEVCNVSKEVAESVFQARNIHGKPVVPFKSTDNVKMTSNNFDWSNVSSFFSINIFSIWKSPLSKVAYNYNEHHFE